MEVDTVGEEACEDDKEEAVSTKEAWNKGTMEEEEEEEEEGMYGWSRCSGGG